MIQTKVCTKCKIEKPVSGFFKQHDTHSGYAAQCKDCHSLYCKKNRKAITLRAKEYRKNNKEIIKQISKRQREKHKEIIKVRARKYYEENKERLVLKASKYRKENKE
jgi:hypothetical protein